MSFLENNLFCTITIFCFVNSKASILSPPKHLRFSLIDVGDIQTIPSEEFAFAMFHSISEERDTEFIITNNIYVPQTNAHHQMKQHQLKKLTLLLWMLKILKANHFQLKFLNIFYIDECYSITQRYLLCFH